MYRKQSTPDLRLLRNSKAGGAPLHRGTEFSGADSFRMSLLFLLLWVASADFFSEPRYIIRFTQYRPVPYHVAAMSCFLGPPWRPNERLRRLWTANPGGRHSAAMAHPTDFLVVSLVGDFEHAPLLASLHRWAKSSSNTVRDISIDSSYRSPLAPPVPTSQHFRDESRAQQLPRMKAFQRSWSFDAPGGNDADAGFSTTSEHQAFNRTGKRRRVLQKGGNRIVDSAVSGVVTSTEGKGLHAKGLSGQGVKVAVFDTGLHPDHPHFRNVVERINWTDDQQLHDAIGHGTFVSGVICSSYKDCPGWAPDAALYVFRVFTNDQVSYTSWFLDAFNYAIWRGIDVLNLSIGGPDHADVPFVEKIWEMSANHIIVVSAIGNDGPVYGTLNNPADQYDVIGVGGVASNGNVARFSSRGMSTWELPFGFGRFKPDLTAPGASVVGSQLLGKSKIKRNGCGCRALSGTSVASPVVAGAIALLLSDANYATNATLSASSSSPIADTESTSPASIGAKSVSKSRSFLARAHRFYRASPAAVKQALVESAVRHPAPNIFEQGAGQLNVTGAYEVLADYIPRASFLPSKLDFTDCPYMWPYCSQPMYFSGQPIGANLTIINGLGVHGTIDEVIWTETAVETTSSDSSSRQQTHGQRRQQWQQQQFLQVHCDYSSVGLYPWSGYFAVRIEISAAGAALKGVVTGSLSLTISAVDTFGLPRRQVLVLPVAVAVIPTPPRRKRLLWDQFHSISYPSGYVPRDDLKVTGDMLDWTGDHIHTNFRDAYIKLRSAGYFVEILSSDFTCFNAWNYGALLVVDPEDEFFPEEVAKLENDIREKALSLVVFADWYHATSIRGVAFFDDNTRSDWKAVTGGCNIPALNNLLQPFGIAFSDRIFDGIWTRSPRAVVAFLSGVSIAKFPANGWLRSASSGLKERNIPASKNARNQKSHFRGGAKGSQKNGRSPSGHPSEKGTMTLEGAPPHHQSALFVNASLGTESRRRALAQTAETSSDRRHQDPRSAPRILGAVDICDISPGCTPLSTRWSGRGGRVAVYGDSSCIDSWGKTGSSLFCFDLLLAMVAYAATGERSKAFFRDSDRLPNNRGFIDSTAISYWSTTRRADIELVRYSRVIGSEAGQSCRW